MMAWFEENPVGKTLAAICSALILISVLLAVLWMIPPSASAPSSSVEDAQVAGLDLPEFRAAKSIEEYAEITNRPVFNESRQPIIELDDEGADDELLQDDFGAPDVELAGVIITPSLRMATLRTKGEQQSLVAFEGRPLEGNYGSWQISRIEPREVTLSSGDGEELQLQLEVHMATIAAPPKVAETSDAAVDLDENNRADRDGDQPLSRAEEIRERIAERREELRRAAEENEEPKAEMSYQQAIQSMMGKKRQDKSSNEQKE